MANLIENGESGLSIRNKLNALFDLAGNGTLTALALGGATRGSDTLAVAGPVTISGVNGLLAAGPASANSSSNHHLSVNSGASTDNVLELQNLDPEHYSAVRVTSDQGVEKGAWGYGNPSSLAVFADSLYTEGYQDSVDIRFITNLNQGVNLALLKSSGNLAMYASSGSSGTAYGTKVFQVARSNGDAFFLGALGLGGITAPGGKLDVLGMATVGNEAVGGRAGDETAAFNILDSGSELLRLTKSSVMTMKFKLQGTSTSKRLDLEDTDNSGIVPLSIALNGTGDVTFGGRATFSEKTAPSAPDADKVIVYAVDNGAGKTQLMALFSSGAAQQLAIQP